MLERVQASGIGCSSNEWNLARVNSLRKSLWLRDAGRLARTGRPKAELVLTGDERETLTRWARRRTSSQALVLRCRIVLESATGASNKDVADRLGVEAHTVSR
jgi:DNA-binding CsgD family transcriptional regulator